MLQIRELTEAEREAYDEMNAAVMETCYASHRMTMELNNKYHEPQEIREILPKITGVEIDESFNMFPPFYTDFGRNIHIGKMCSSMPVVISRIRGHFYRG